jgi:hypothetical protein
VGPICIVLALSGLECCGVVFVNVVRHRTRSAFLLHQVGGAGVVCRCLSTPVNGLRREAKSSCALRSLLAALRRQEPIGDMLQVPFGALDLL